jgi:hypothetical protein
MREYDGSAGARYGNRGHMVPAGLLGADHHSHHRWSFVVTAIDVDDGEELVVDQVEYREDEATLGYRLYTPSTRWTDRQRARR